MAWIELHQSLWTHRKTVILAATLGINELYAAAHMSKLWTWALDNAQNGDLTGLPNKVIAFGAGWTGDENAFVDALVSSGWVDRDGGSMSLHDWYDYAGRLIDKKNANKERMRNARAKNVQRTNDAQPSHVQGLPNHTLPNLTIPKEIEKESDRDRLLKLFNELEIKGGGALGLDKVFSYIGTVDVEVIELALKAAEKKHVNYFVSTINGWIAEGKTTAALVNPIPEKGEYKGTASRPSRGYSSKPSMPVVQSQGQAPVVSDEERKKMRELARRLKHGETEETE